MDRSLPRPTDDFVSLPSAASSIPTRAPSRDQLEPARGATLWGVLAAFAFHAGVIWLSPREAARAALSIPVDMELFEAPLMEPEPKEPEPKLEEPPPAPEPPVAAMLAPVERRRAPEPAPAKPAQVKSEAPPPKAEEDVPPPAPAAAPAAEAPEKLAEPAPALVAAEGKGDASNSIVASAGGAFGGRGTGGAGVPGGTGTGAVGSKQGVVGGTGTGGSATPVTLSLKDWKCAWPDEAEYEDFDQQVVSIRVVVAEDGRVESAEILKDPGFGFGRAARDCARRVRFNPAKDAGGRAVRAVSPPINVRFVR